MTDLPLEFHRDKNGAAKATWTGKGEAGHLLSRFFESELAGDAAYCARLETEAEKHRHAPSAAWSTSGNSFAVTIQDNQVYLCPLYGTEQKHAYVLDLADFLALLHKWRAIVK